MRRLFLATGCLAITAAVAGPAFGAPPVPVGVGKDSKGGECVYAFSWVPQCVDPSSAVSHRSAATGYPPPCPPRQPGAQIANGNAYVYSGCITVVIPLPGIAPPPTA